MITIDKIFFKLINNPTGKPFQVFQHFQVTCYYLQLKCTILINTNFLTFMGAGISIPFHGMKLLPIHLLSLRTWPLIITAQSVKRGQ